MGSSWNSASAAIGPIPSADFFLNSAGVEARDTGNSPLPPRPLCVEVPPCEASRDIKYTLEQINIGGVSLAKGRVSTHDVFSTVANSDLVPGKYEGGLKLWEGSLDLVRCLDSEIQNGDLSLEGKKVLELGCGHGLPGIFAYLKGASAVHFQDFNAEVLGCLTIPNVMQNFPNLAQIANHDCTSNAIRYFAGDWRDLKNVLPYAPRAFEDHQTPSKVDLKGGYDVILMAETFYSLSILPALYSLVKECISHPSGAVYLAGKKHYFGVGGGTRRFVKVVEEDGVMDASMISEVSDGTSNVREVWKLSPKQN